MQKLTPSALLAMFSLSLLLFTTAATASDSKTDEEDSYFAEIRKEAVKEAAKNVPEPVFQPETEGLVDEADHTAITKTSKEDMGNVGKIKPAFSKPKLKLLQQQQPN